MSDGTATPQDPQTQNPAGGSVTVTNGPAGVYQTTSTTNTPAGTVTLGPDGQPWDPNRAMSTIAAIRKDVSDRDDQLKAANDEIARLKAEAQQASETDAERQAREKAEADERAAKVAQDAAAATAALRRGKLLAALAKPEHGIVDVEAAAALIGGVEYDEQGQPTNLTTKDGENPSLLDRFLTDKPYLRATPNTPAPPNANGGGGTNPVPGPPLTAEELQIAKSFGMTPEEYAANK